MTDIEKRLKRHLEINDELKQIITKRNLELRYCKRKICKLEKLLGEKK